jgi:hypothetical protein
MKKIILILMMGVMLSSCNEKGVTMVNISGDENGLPDELKGLKIYTVSNGGVGSVKVAVIDDQVNSLTYHEGKQDKTTIIVDKTKTRLIEVGDIMMENDSMITFKKIITKKIITKKVKDRYDFKFDNCGGDNNPH